MLNAMRRPIALSLVVETVGFWLFVMGPAAAFMFHRETGDWVPGDREAARQFAQFFASVWVFCRIPPVEGARWASKEKKRLD